MPSGTSSDLTLPELNVQDQVLPLQIDPQQKFSSPPPRYSEASLVKALEAEGIGRPSTYAAIIKTIQDRGYVEQVDRRFYATDKGQIVTEKLVVHFPKIMDLKFTSYMEDELDKIEERAVGPEKISLNSKATQLGVTIILVSTQHHNTIFAFLEAAL